MSRDNHYAINTLSKHYGVIQRKQTVLWIISEKSCLNDDHRCRISNIPKLNIIDIDELMVKYKNSSPKPLCKIERKNNITVHDELK